MLKLFRIIIGLGMAIALALPFACIHQMASHKKAVAASAALVESTFAHLSAGHTRVLARYRALERDRTDERAVITWVPTACERDALAMLFDMQAQAAYDVPVPYLMRGDPPRPGPVLSGATLTLACHIALNPGPVLPPTLPHALPPPPRPLVIPGLPVYLTPTR